MFLEERRAPSVLAGYRRALRGGEVLIQGEHLHWTIAFRCVENLDNGGFGALFSFSVSWPWVASRVRR